jgi:hypothetical protein
MSDPRIYVIGNKMININKVNYIKIETDHLKNHCVNFNFGKNPRMHYRFRTEIQQCFETQEEMYQAVKQISQHWNK